MGNDELTSVRERLEKLKENPRKVPKPLAPVLPERERRSISDGMLTFERVFQQKVEKAIKKIEAVKARMEASQNFANYFYDLKEAEKEFLEILTKAEEKHVEFPAGFIKKIEAVKSKIRSKIR